MAFSIDLMDYKGDKYTASYPDISVSDILVAWITVVTGDETLTIVTYDGDVISDSTYSAIAGFYDGEYDIIKKGRWIVPEEEFRKRRGSYDFLYGC